MGTPLYRSQNTFERLAKVTDSTSYNNKSYTTTNHLQPPKSTQQHINKHYGLNVAQRLRGQENGRRCRCRQARRAKSPIQIQLRRLLLLQVKSSVLLTTDDSLDASTT